MKHKRLILMLVAILALTTGCQDAIVSPTAEETVIPITPEDDAIFPFENQEGSVNWQALATELGLTTTEKHRTSPLVGSINRVYTFADPTGAPVGRSWLMRTPNGIGFALYTSELVPQSTATLWVVVFNDPENCSPAEENGPPACGEDDLFNADARVDVLYADGEIIRDSGNAGFVGIRRIGDNAGSVWEVLGLPSPGLIDSYKAEIHFVVRDHGPYIAGMKREMTGTFNGGCELGDFPPDPRLGAEGPNTCVDVHFAVHKP